MSDEKPVADAEVVVETFVWGHIHVWSETTHTDAAGLWSMPRRLEWRPMILGVPEGPSWWQDVTFRTGDGALILEASDTPRASLGGDVVRDQWRARFDRRNRNDGPRLVPVVGLMAGRAQLACAYGGGLLFLAHWPVRLALRGEAELGLKGAAAFAGLAVGLPTQTMPVLNLDVGARLFRPWDAASGAGAALGPEISFELLSMRVAVASVRALTPDANGRREWTTQLLFGLGYM